MFGQAEALDLTCAMLKNYIICLGVCLVKMIEILRFPSLPKIGSLPVVFYFLKPNKLTNSLGDELVLQLKYSWLKDPDLI